MSTIPNSAMPHAGGTSSTSGDTRISTNISGGSQPGDYTGDTFYSVGQRGNDTSLLDRARDHKTGIAVGVAVGAIAAAAIPFMLSGRKRSSELREPSAGRQADYSVETEESSARPVGKNRS